MWLVEHQHPGASPVQDTVEHVVRGGGCGAGTGSSAGAFERRQRDTLPRCTHNTSVNHEVLILFSLSSSSNRLLYLSLSSPSLLYLPRFTDLQLTKTCAASVCRRWNSRLISSADSTSPDNLARDNQTAQRAEAATHVHARRGVSGCIANTTTHTPAARPRQACDARRQNKLAKQRASARACCPQ
jgi:hypothetical protein